LKHHVFEQVREAAAPKRFEAKTDLVINADGHEWRGTVRRHDDAKSVRESGVFDGDVETLQGFTSV
jgi:hypothetical protein